MATRAAVRRRPETGRSTKAPRRASERLQTVSVSATEAKNEFGRILEQVIRGGRVVITRHAAPKAVLLSVEEYAALSAAPGANLDTLTKEFDAMLVRMQTPEARRKMQATFDASPEELARAGMAAWNKA